MRRTSEGDGGGSVPAMVDEQLADFGRALLVAMRARGVSYAEVAELVGVSEDAVRLWVKARREPERVTVFELERVLGRRPGDLSRLLGYLPVSARSSVSVLDAIEADPDLSADVRTVLRAAYRAGKRLH